MKYNLVSWTCLQKLKLCGEQRLHSFPSNFAWHNGSKLEKMPLFKHHRVLFVILKLRVSVDCQTQDKCTCLLTARANMQYYDHYHPDAPVKIKHNGYPALPIR